MAIFDSFKLDGKVAVVTGGRTGIDSSLTRAVAQAGAKMVIAARDIEGCRSAAAEIVASGGSAIAVPLDITDRSQIEALVTVVYLASEASSFMTGSVIVVDGGYSLW